MAPSSASGYRAQLHWEDGEVWFRSSWWPEWHQRWHQWINWKGDQLDNTSQVEESLPFLIWRKFGAKAGDEANRSQDALSPQPLNMLPVGLHFEGGRDCLTCGIYIYVFPKVVRLNFHPTEGQFDMFCPSGIEWFGLRSAKKERQPSLSCDPKVENLKQSPENAGKSMEIRHISLVTLSGYCCWRESFQCGGKEMAGSVPLLPLSDMVFPSLSMLICILGINIYNLLYIVNIMWANNKSWVSLRSLFFLVTALGAGWRSIVSIGDSDFERDSDLETLLELGGRVVAPKQIWIVSSGCLLRSCWWNCVLFLETDTENISSWRSQMIIFQLLFVTSCCTFYFWRSRLQSCSGGEIRKSRWTERLSKKTSGHGTPCNLIHVNTNHAKSIGFWDPCYNML